MPARCVYPSAVLTSSIVGEIDADFAHTYMLGECATRCALVVT